MQCIKFTPIKNKYTTMNIELPGGMNIEDLQKQMEDMNMKTNGSTTAV